MASTYDMIDSDITLLYVFRMTGVGGRPELIIEGSMDGELWRVGIK